MPYLLCACLLDRHAYWDAVEEADQVGEVDNHNPDKQGIHLNDMEEVQL